MLTMVCLPLVLITADAVAGTNSCSAREARVLFVDAATMIRQKTDNKSISDATKDVMKILREITKCHKSTKLAVKLISGQKIGEISFDETSIRKLITKYAFMKKIPTICQCKILSSDIKCALSISSKTTDDALIAVIIRKLVRRKDFNCALAFVEEVNNNDTKKHLRDNVVRSLFRSALNGKGSIYCSDNSEGC